jgi:hypothetical protein
MVLNPLINYNTKYNLLHPYSLRFFHRFLVPHPNLNSEFHLSINQMSHSYPFKQQNSQHHVHIFREDLVEYRVSTPSETWNWQTFLQDGITEHPILGFVSIIRSNCGSPAIIKLFTSKTSVS